jgi:hypothetical protein
MKEPEASAASDEAAPAPRLSYERPQIVWREPYEPVSYGVSCAHEPGNPPCIGFFSA